MGEAYFAQKLLDYEMASNVGNWQWVAGCGVDAAPYFRIFNPTEQIKKFDKNHDYIKKWVPNYQSPSYPKPIVDHKMARERCLETYKSALNKWEESKKLTSPKSFVWYVTDHLGGEKNGKKIGIKLNIVVKNAG